MSDKRKIYDYIKRTINPYGRPFEGTAYELGLKIMDYIENMDDEKENGWIPVKYHQISEKEREEESISRDIHYILDCKMPDDEQEILVTNGKSTWRDTSFIDCDGYYLDSNYDWIEITAWRPLPEPYKED